MIGALPYSATATRSNATLGNIPYCHGAPKSFQTLLHNPPQSSHPPHSTDQFASRDLASSYLESLKPADSSLANTILSPFTRIKLLRHFTPDHASQSDRLPTQ
ncbi:hypothetical protein RJZ57_008435 [Blastomyces gilchristii]